VLCSVVKHAENGRARKECRGKHETQSGFTTEQSRGEAFLFVNDKESNKFPTHSADYFQKSKSGVSGALFSDKALSNKLITIPVSIVQ